jgi:hypothetical protein
MGGGGSSHCELLAVLIRRVAVLSSLRAGVAQTNPGKEGILAYG